MIENQENVALVTGASSGIGLEIAKLLLEKNYIVYGIGRTFSADLGKNFYALQIDLMDTHSLEQRIKLLRKKHLISVLVNCAGVGYFGLHEELNSRKIHEMITVNVEVPLLLTQLLLRDLKKSKGYLFNISSVTAKKTNPHGCAYGATKSALTSFSNSLFEEARKYGVKITTIHPDMTKSNFYRNADFKEGQKKDSYLLGKEVAQFIDIALSQDMGTVLSEVTIKPQRHELTKQNK